MSLPIELSRRCLELLDFRTRIFASHISRAWRDVALANPAMWNQARFSFLTRRSAVTVLETMLARSDPLPFSFVWVEVDIYLPHDLLTAVLRHMPRMAEITVSGIDTRSCRLLLSRDAPLMRAFVCIARGSGYVVLPAHWAPQLRVLHLRNFVVPSSTPRFSALRSFSGRVSTWAEGRIDNVNGRLYSVMSNLTTLDLVGISQATIPYLLHPPPTLQELRLHSDRASIDYSALLEHCAGCSLRILVLNNAASVYGAAQLFTAMVPSGSWTFGGGNVVVMQSDAHQTRYEVHSNAPISFLHEPALFSRMDGVSELALPMSMLVDVYGMTLPDCSLPSLRALTASIDHSSIADRFREMADQTHPSIGVPQLSRLTVMVEDEPQPLTSRPRPLEHTIGWLADELPRVLETILDLSLIEQMTISMRDAVQLARHDLTALLALAGRLCVEDRSKGEMVKLGGSGGCMLSIFASSY
ncbi:hypothetical protein AURDEDRAFT_168076 [Auricularia subglabra TFB-10046 SS5]|nr:hypothetical protein AURDEDRAFT_168076 [Auricularia subglabra TFB-10046 SS5]